ncbi:MAG: glycoside hydrolase family 3 N-terminal domain-containing protein [Bacteroidota bacterium]
MHHQFYLLTLLFISLTTCSGQPSSSSTDEMKGEIVITDAILGQLIMCGFRGMSYDSLSPLIKEQITSGEIGNIILFDYDVGHKTYERNVRSPEQVMQFLKDLQANSPTPLFTAVDQEGGKVNRLKERYGFTALPSAQYLGSQATTDSTAYYAVFNSESLYALGFNVNFAPVVDLNVNPDNPVIGKIERSFGTSSEQVIAHARAWIQAHEEMGILSVLKHFPGHGSSEADSHKGFTDVTNSWSEAELVPYQELLKDEAGLAVMTAHVFNRNIDSLYPATLSPHYIQTILRDSSQYDGLVFSDDLQMNAVSKLYDFKTIIRQSFLAGVDVLVFGNNLENYNENIAREAIKCIRELLAEGSLTQERLLESYERVQLAKARQIN